MTTQQDDDVRADERLQNLGLVVDRGTTLDKTLRDAFCSIIGNKYAVVLTDGRSAEWLIRNCRKVLRKHREITGEHRANILVALDGCESANDRRNDLVNGARTATGASDGRPCTTNDAGCQADGATETAAEKILDVANALAEANTKLFCAMKNAVSPEVMVIGQALAWEQRREPGTPC